MAGYCHDTPVLHPTKEEFSKPFCQYINKILKKHPDVAMFKVVPPEGWKPRRSPLPKLQKLEIQCPIKQLVFGTRGTYRAVLMEQKPLTAYEFRDIAVDDDHLPPNKERDKSDELLERAFWSSITINPPLYGADTPMSLFDEKLPYGWNLRDLGDLLKRPDIPQVAGVTTPMTYFGMWKSFFAWHVEDADLFSINYLHFGAPKVWYCVSPAHRAKFERMVQSLFPELHKHCHAFMRHKDVLLSPALLKNYGIEYLQAKQEPNEFIVLNAGAYHAGYNLGFNIAEAVNFATEEWIELGRKVVRCKCNALAEGVRISMRLFGCSSGSSATSDEEESGSEDEESGSEDGEVTSGERSGESSDDDAQHGTRKSRRVRRSSSAAAAEESSRKRRGSAAAAAESPSKRSRRDISAAVGPSPVSPKGPRQTKTSLAAAAAAQKMRRTHATAEARAKLAQQHEKRSRLGAAPVAGAGRDAGVKKTRLGKPAQMYNKADHLSESLQRAAAAAAAMRARAEAEAAAAAAAEAQQPMEQDPAAAAAAAAESAPIKQEQQQLDEQQQQQKASFVKQECCAPTAAVLTRKRSTSTNISAAAETLAAVPAPSTPPAAAGATAAAISSDPESPRANKAKLSEGGVVAAAAAAAPGGPPAGEAPHVIIGEEKGGKYFYMVQVLRDVAPKQRGHLVMRWLKEGRDGLFRPSTETWEEVPGALVAVRTQWVAGKAGTAGGYRLLTMRSRILETELVD